MSVQRTKSLLAPKIWKRDEILTFLDIFESTFHASVSDPFDSESDMWECISNKLLAQGFTASAQHCQSKWNFLYKTYINNQNRQGVFYAKIKQIVEFSQQLNENTEQVGCKNIEQLNDNKAACEGETNGETKADENLHEEEQTVEELVETLEESDQVAPDTIPDSEKPTDSPDELGEEVLEEVPPLPPETSELVDAPLPPAKRLKLESLSEQEITMNNEAIHVEAMNISDVLLSIVGKIDAIHKEQISQNKRLEAIERLQLENKQTLLDIKTFLNLK